MSIIIFSRWFPIGYQVVNLFRISNTTSHDDFSFLSKNILGRTANDNNPWRKTQCDLDNRTSDGHRLCWSSLALCDYSWNSIVVPETDISLVLHPCWSTADSISLKGKVLNQQPILSQERWLVFVSFVSKCVIDKTFLAWQLKETTIPCFLVHFSIKATDSKMPSCVWKIADLN